ncbi:formylmethanofuran dehydrogenase subunit A [Hansschlegelia zhihuaiae]|uniref:Formylmethanofuran dehydrogenase subunit A n=1 Tax=Hansschlegelia zhihuaiae TaxID=405005 RepID=A0A4Q0MNK6_9HYPH|nr:formylmethanofuran dehydrogenase subunit A [Hansschlegelia zhihuaiae]RXF74616.1 formylmethanofuran dehydrogenase subunit A [Hansschlegelia zhihuaiae]
MTAVRITNGKVLDPANGEAGVARDVVVVDGRIAAADAIDGAAETIDAKGGIVMAGGIDIHSHIAGGKSNIARMLMVEEQRAIREPQGPFCACGGGLSTMTAHATGCRYAEMGYTAVFEPAVIAANARHMHAEMADIPFLDTGGYLVLGNDDFLLDLIATGAGQQAVNDYVAWQLNATKTMAIKIVNPGGINAFKFNSRWMNLDEKNPRYEVTPRTILQTLIRAVTDLGLAHPIHLHGCNLGVPGNMQTTLDTIGATEGLPLHMTHVQFHSYGTEGDRKFSSGAAAIAEAVNKNPNISIDVGQVMFGQTVTASADFMTQHRNRGIASPGRFIGMDIEMDAACGILPFNYKDKSFVNALQWAIGLELFLLVEDPWRIFLTTDHPNGGPFTTYPHLIKLLMDRSFREEQFSKLAKSARKHSNLLEIRREYTLEEIAIVTRAAPAKILGLTDRGHLGAGAVGDVVVYRDDPDREAMFSRASYVLKDGTVIVKDGEIVDLVYGRTHQVAPDYDGSMDARMDRWFDEALGYKARTFKLSDDEIRGGQGAVKHETVRSS